MGEPRSQHFVLASREIESVTRRVGRWGFSKVYLLSQKLFSTTPAFTLRISRTGRPLSGQQATSRCTSALQAWSLTPSRRQATVV